MRSAGLSPIETAIEEKSPPSIRVAEVKTAVLSESSLSRIWLQTWSGATQSRGGIRSPPSLSHSTSASEPAAIRSAVTNTSWTMPRAWVRPASTPSSPAPLPSASRGYAESTARAASRTSTSASLRASGTSSNRPGDASSMASWSASPASARSSAAFDSPTCRWERRAARSTSLTASSSVAAWVTRATSSCASSTTTAS